MKRLTIADALLAVILRAVKAHFEQGLHPYGVHAGQQFILQHLWRENDLTPGDLARRIGVEVPTIVRAVQRMEATGLVHRERDVHDARLVRVRLAPRGEELRTVLPAILQRLSDEVYAGLSADERQQLERLLTRMARNLGIDA